MLRVGLITALFAGCSGNEDTTLLVALDGSWDGTVTVEPAIYPASGLFTWDEEKQLLSGQLEVIEPDLPHTYAIRRSTVGTDEVTLELTDATDGTRGLRLIGTVAGTFDGSATLRYPCDAGTCGYVGVLALTKGLGTPSTGDTGAAR